MRLKYAEDLHNAGNESRNIVWCILSTEDQSTDDATNTTQTSKTSRTECTSPLASDVSSLVRHHAGNCTVGATDGDEDA